MRISLGGDTIAQLVSASDTFNADKMYDLARVHLIRVGCPRELAASRENKLNVPVVVERNRQKLGYIQATGYFPAAVVVAGAYRRDQLLARGILDSWGWVERGAVEIQAADTLSAGELTEKLTNLLQIKFYGNNKPIYGQPWPYICQLYPFESYLVYEFAGQRYRQMFTINPQSNDVQLSGDSTKVSEQFVNACGISLPRTQDGMRQANNPLPLAGNWVSSYPNPNSDLIRMVVRNFSNVEAVVGKMLAAIKTGLYRPLKPDFAPVNLSDDGKILGPLVEAGIAPADFVCWADGPGAKYMKAREFSDKSRKSLADKGQALPDGSFPIATRGDLKNAVKAFGRASNPTAAKKHIIKRAHALGSIDVLPDDWKK